jgi:CBS domain-containing protein
MKAQDIMSRRVVTVRRDSELKQAIATMLERGISGMPVTDENGALVGMLTEGDLLRRSELGMERRRPRWLEFLIGPGRLAAEYTHAHGRAVADAMSESLHYATPGMSLQQVVEMMEKQRIKRVPVLDNGRLVGIITRADLLRALALAAPSLPAVSPSDAQIRQQLEAELAASAWAPRSMLNVVVQNREVHLYGTILDGREREALRVAARNIPGVAAVHDHLVWCEPTSGMVLEAPSEPDQPGQRGA